MSLKGVIFSPKVLFSLLLFISCFSLQQSLMCLCCLCQKMVRNKGNLVQHMEVNHIIAKVARYPCPLCDEKFVTRRKLTRHKNKECAGSLQTVQITDIDRYGL